MTTTINQKVASPFGNVVTAETDPVTGVVELNVGGQSYGIAQTYTWDQVQALTSVPAGTRAYVSDLGYSEWVYNGTRWITQTPVILFKTAIPIISPPNGTMGNNGALVLGTTMPAAYPSAYMVLKLGDIYESSPAGIYYCVFSDSSHCTVYNNTLVFTNGVVVPPANPVPFVCTGPGAGHPATNTGGDNYHIQNLATIPGGVIGANGEMRVKAAFNYVGSGNSGTLKFAGTVFHQIATSASASLNLDVGLRNRGVLNAQVASNPNVVSDAHLGGADELYTIDTSVSNAVDVLSYTGTASTGYCVLQWFEVSVVSK